MDETSRPSPKDVTTGQFLDPRSDIKDALIDVMQRLSDRMAGKRNSEALSTGFDELDELLDGLGNKQLILLAGLSYMGKTAFALQLTDYLACDSGKAVLYAGMQEGVEELTERLLVSRARIDPWSIRIGRGLANSEMTALSKAYEELKQASIHFSCSPIQTFNQIEEEARRLKHDSGLDLIVIDAFQLLVMAEGFKRAPGRCARLCQRIKQLACEMDVPVLVLSQFDDNIRERKEHRPRIADLFERNEVERFADKILLLYQSEYFDPTDRPGVAEIIVAKNRSGQTGFISLAFQRNPSFYSDIPNIVSTAF